MELSRHICVSILRSLVHTQGAFVSGLEMLKALHEAGAVRLSDKVPHELPNEGYEIRSQAGKSLGSAIMGVTLANNTRWTQSSVSPDAAEILLEIDPQFFQNHQAELWQVFDSLLRPSQVLQKTSKPGQPSSLDQWATIAVSSLSLPLDTNQWNLRAFENLLALNLPYAAMAMAKRNDEWWYMPGGREKSVLSRATDKCVWDVVLGEQGPGIDVRRLVGKDHPLPLWRALLPQKTTTPADPGSMREAIENWVDRSIDAGDPDPKLLKYRLMAFTGMVTGTSWKNKTDPNRKADIINSLPAQWSQWEVNKEPAWIHVMWSMCPKKKSGSSDIDPSKWIELVNSNPGWVLQGGPSIKAMVEMLVPGQAGPPSLEIMTGLGLSKEDVDLLSSESAKFSSFWKVPLSEVQVWFQALDMSVSTPQTKQLAPRTAPRL